MKFTNTKIWMSFAGASQPRRSWPGASGRREPRAFRLLDDRLKCFRLTKRELGEDLAIDFDTGLGEAIDEARIGKALLAHRRVQALNPQGTKNPLLGAPVARRILHRAIDRRLRRPDRVLAAAIKALGGPQCFLVLGVRGNPAFHACHGSSPD